MSDGSTIDASMRVVRVHGAGDLRIDEVATPALGPGQVSVDIVYGGICGSDLHYYQRGGVGDFHVREPLILGHEVVGRVRALGPGVAGPAVSGLAAGTPVAVHPATPDGDCAQCRAGRRNLCRNTRYLGSAARLPHVQGGFAQVLSVPAEQIYVLPPGLDLRRAALAEPLSVALHAVRRAGDVAGRRVLVTGAGPIGSLVVAALAGVGAAEIVVCDLVDEALAVATAVGATTVVRADRLGSAGGPGSVDGLGEVDGLGSAGGLVSAGGLGEVDVAIEASGSGPGLATCLRLAAPGATVVQLGLLPPGDTGILGNALVTREISLVGSFRFDVEFAEAIALLAGGLPVDPIVTQVVGLDAALEAFDLAGDRRRASKVLLDFT